MDLSSLGKGITALGVVLVVVGGLLWLLGRTGLPLGRLPGDIRIERDGFSFYFPLASSILISIVLTIIINLIGRILKK